VGKWGAATLMTGLGIAFAPSCQEATGIRLVLRTNVPNNDQVSVALFAGTAEDIEAAAPVAEVESSAWEAEQNVGSITFVPQGDGGALSIRVTLARGRQASDCSLASPEGCVFARRRLAFIEHKTLLVPVVLYQQCEGLPCTARTTCNVSRECASSTVLPADCERTQGCPLQGDPAIGEVIAPADKVNGGDRDAAADSRAGGGPSTPNMIDGATEAGPGTPGDASSDAANDGPRDSSIGDGGVYSAGPIVSCFYAGNCQGSTPVCCHTAGATAVCVARGMPCPSGQRVACDNREDCASNNVCCKKTGQPDIDCFDAFACFGNHKIVCVLATATNDCSIAATTQCTSRTYWGECGP